MKLSKLINELIALKIKHGDLEVWSGDPDYGELYPVTQVREDGGTADIYHHYGSYCRECRRGCD